MNADTATATPTTGKGPTPGRGTIGELWAEAAAVELPHAAYLVEDGTEWKAVSRGESAAVVRELANGFLALGLRKGDVLGIVARTSLDWVQLDYALALAGLISAPVYPNSSAQEAAYVLRHVGAAGAIVEDDLQREKLEPEHAAGTLRQLLTFSQLGDLRSRGRAYAESAPTALEERASSVSADDVYTFLFTSGTTGAPKACVITHRNYRELVESVDRIPNFIVADDVVFLWLPLAHNFGRLVHLVQPRIGCTIALCADPARIGEALPVVRPTVLPSVPRLFEKVHGTVVTRFSSETGVRRRLVDWAQDVGRRVSGERQAGRRIGRGLALQHRLADRLVFAKVKQRLGGRVRAAFSGGAPLDPEIAQFFHSLDVLILEGYGLSECTSAATANRLDRFRFGTVGVPLPGVEVETAADGEILISGPGVFSGYHDDEDATREALSPDGWLRTGDIGEIDADGFLRITDRKKDIIVTAGGKNVAPQNLENDVKRSEYVSQALVVGDRRPYLAALVTLDREPITAWAREHGHAKADPAELAGDQEVEALVAEAVADANRERASWEQIKRFAILPRDFTLENGELTPTMKLKRRVCEQHFATEIEALYR